MPPTHAPPDPDRRCRRVGRSLACGLGLLVAARLLGAEDGNAKLLAPRAVEPPGAARTNLPGPAVPVVTRATPSRTNEPASPPAGSLLSESELPYSTPGVIRSDAEEVRARARAEELAELTRRLETGRRLRLSKLYSDATPHLTAVLSSKAPEELQRSALLELALVAQEENNLARALQILSQYLSRWPQDPTGPEILLRQGLIYRQLGIHELALTKFYATMTTALTLKDGHFDYYRKLVLQSQAEIAETLALQNKHAEAAQAFARLLKEESPALNRVRVQFRYIHSLEAQGKYSEAAGQAQDFLAKYADAGEQAEVRFLLASSLKRLGRNGDALREVLELLQSQQPLARSQPGTLAYWQQRTGNEIANQLYQEGDFVHALEIYLNLLPLNPAPAWQLPVLYQVGLVYERLEQPVKAVGAFGQIIDREAEVGTNAPPGLRAMLDMARWRRDFLDWRGRTEATHHELRAGLAPEPGAPASPTAPPPP